MDYDSWKLATPDSFSELVECSLCKNSFDISRIHTEITGNIIRSICNECFKCNSLEYRVEGIITATKKGYICVHEATKLVLKLIDEIIENENERQRKRII